MPSTGWNVSCGGAADDLGGLARVLQARQLDDDAPLAGAGERRLGDAERVDPAAQHLQRAVGGLRVGLDGGRVLGLEDDLGAAAQVETRGGRAWSGRRRWRRMTPSAMRARTSGADMRGLRRSTAAAAVADVRVRRSGQERGARSGGWLRRWGRAGTGQASAGAGGARPRAHSRRTTGKATSPTGDGEPEGDQRRQHGCRRERCGRRRAVTTEGRAVHRRGRPDVMTKPGRDRGDRAHRDRGRCDLAVDAGRTGTDQHRGEDGEHTEQRRGQAASRGGAEPGCHGGSPWCRRPSTLGQDGVSRTSSTHSSTSDHRPGRRRAR